MPWRKQTLVLPANPPSVRAAREWVADVLVAIGRPELAESARLAVSELVTNAMLHADPPMTVNVRGTTAHPRIEVTDRSLIPPQPHANPVEVDPDDELTWSTVGRGLDLVATHAVAWGADIDAGGLGKVVWFEPSAEPVEHPLPGAVFDLDSALRARGGTPVEPTSFIAVELLGFPVELFLPLRIHFSELGRELRLLALTNPTRYPMAVEFADIYLQIEQERRQVRGIEVLEHAIREHRQVVDLHYLVPPTAPASMARAAELLEEVYATLADESLLAVRPSSDLLALQRWYLGEFVRQGTGLPPAPWTGPVALPEGAW